MSNSETKSTLDKKPPFFKNWKQIYLLVIGVLCVLIILFYWFTISFS
jgi:hypothetical protein